MYFVVNMLSLCVDWSDNEGKSTSVSSADSGILSPRSLQQQLSTGSQSTAVGPADFLELYRTRTVSDPRSDQRLDALSRVRMKKVGQPVVSLTIEINSSLP